MSADSVALVAHTALGWSTYWSQLRDIAADRTDTQYHYLPYEMPLPARALSKVTNLDGIRKLTGRIDPIILLKGWAGRSIRRTLDVERIGAVHFGGHWISAALAYREVQLPFTVALDATRVNICKDLKPGRWDIADIARERDLLRRAAHLYPWSSWAARSLEDDYGIDPNKITIIPPSLDLKLIPFHPMQRLSDRKVRILFVGNDFIRKGGPRLLRWLAGPLKGRCELFIASARYRVDGSPEGVHALGAVEHRRLITEILPAMDLLCHPTESDMSAFVVAEAAAAGRPVVASRIGGIGDLVAEGETGLLVRPDSDSDFVAAINSLVEDHERMRMMSENARAFAEKNLNREKNCGILLDGLRSLAARSQAVLA